MNIFWRNIPLICILPIFSAAACSRAQTTYAQPSQPLGVTSPGTYHSFDFDTVNVGSGNVVLHIPLLAYPQRGDLSLSFSAKSNAGTWSLGTDCGWEDTTCEFYYYNSITAANNFENASGVKVGPTITPDQGWSVIYNEYSLEKPTADGTFIGVQYEAVDSSASEHPLYYDSTNFTNLRSTDGTELLYSSATMQPYFWLDATNTGTITDRKGIQYSLGNNTITDLHGNIITLQPTVNVTDSVNRTIPWPGSGISGNASPCPNLSTLYSATNQPASSSVLWSVPGPNGVSVTYTLCYANINIHTNFFGNNGQNFNSYNVPGPCGDGIDEPQCNYIQDWVEEVQSVQALQSIILPDHTFWGFIYDSADTSNASSFAYGNLLKVIEPTGGTVSYSYQLGANCYVADPTVGNEMQSVRYGGYSTTFHLTSRTETDGLGNTYVWSYGGNQGAIYQGNSVTDPNGNETLYEFDNGPYSSGCSGGGLESSRKVYEGSSSSGKLLKTITSTNQWYLPPQNFDIYTLFPYPGSSASLVTNVTTNIDGVASNVVSTSYAGTFSTTFPICSGENNGRCILDTVGTSATIPMAEPSTKTVSDGNGSILTQTQIAYAWQTNSSYWNANLLNTPISTIISDGSGNQLSVTTATYDERQYSACGICGNKTTVTKWNDIGLNIQTHTAYNNYGMVDHLVDGNKVNFSQYIYGSQYNYLYPTQIVNAKSQNYSFSYDFNTGLVSSSTDPNGNQTVYTFDSGSRITQIAYPDGGLNQYTYSTDTQPVISQLPIITKNVKINSNSSVVTAEAYDGLGRTIETTMQSDPAGADIVDTTYDGIDQVTSITNPYRSGSTVATTTFQYDALGRKTVQTQPDGSKIQLCYDNIASTGQTNCQTNKSNITYALSTNQTDESNISHQAIYDVFGRLIAAIEPNPASGVLALQTTYVYSPLGNLTSVVQSGTTGDVARFRDFTYDSLSRLTTSKNTESGTVCYGQWNSSGNCSSGYDANGNLLYKTDARGIVTNYSYDALNRLIQTTAPLVNSSGAMAGQYQSTCYQYDSVPGAATGANLVGRLTAEWTQSGSTCASSYSPSVGALTAKVILSYDALGRPLMSQQCIKQMCQTTPFTQNQTYDLAGNMTSWTDGRNWMNLSQQFDAAGRPVSVSNSVSGNGWPAVLFSSPAYAPSNALQNWNIGGYLNVSRTYDNRLRVTGEAVIH